MCWTGADKLISEDVTVLHSGGNKHERGVGILLNKEVSGGIMSWEPVDDRSITVRLKTRFTNVTLVQAYAPTEAAPDGDKDFCNQLQAVMDAVPSHDLKILIGDFNAQIGDEDIGKEAMGTCTNNGERLLNLCSSFSLKIGGSISKGSIKVHGILLMDRR